MSKIEQTVYIIDDDDAVRRSLRLLVKSVGLRTETFSSAQEFLEVYDVNQPGCLVLDVRMPGMSGLELQDRLNAADKWIPIIFITGHGDVPMAVQAMRKGAVEFLQKPFRDQELVERINLALQQDAERRNAVIERDQLTKRLDSLTPREREVLDAIVDGHANKAIAIDLDVSQRTVEVHRARVMGKMQARSVAQLVRMVMRAADSNENDH